MGLMLLLFFGHFLEVNADSIASAEKTENWQGFRKLIDPEVEKLILMGMRGLRARPPTWCGYIDVRPPFTESELQELEQYMRSSSFPSEKIAETLGGFIADREHRSSARLRCDSVEESKRPIMRTSGG